MTTKELAKSKGNGGTSWTGVQFDLWRSKIVTESHEDRMLRGAHSFVKEYTCHKPANVQLLGQIFTTIDVPVRVYHETPVSLVDVACSQLTMMSPGPGSRTEESG